METERQEEQKFTLESPEEMPDAAAALKRLSEKSGWYREYLPSPLMHESVRGEGFLCQEVY